MVGTLWHYLQFKSHQFERYHTSIYNMLETFCQKSGRKKLFMIHLPIRNPSISMTFTHVETAVKHQRISTHGIQHQ